MASHPAVGGAAAVTGQVQVASGKVLTASNTLTLAGTDGTTMTFPATSATLARTDAANTFTGVQTMTSPAITTPVFTGAFSGTYSLGGTPTINVATAVGGTWTAAATWTLPAFTLGGTVSGGGNQLNNVIIGTTTPLAGSFTSITATQQISTTAASDISIATGRLSFNSGSFLTQADAASGRFKLGSAVAGSTMLRIVAGGTGDVTMDAWQWDSYTTQKSISIGGSTVAGPTGFAVTGTLSATGITSVTDVTDATAATAASLKTAGGLGVAKAAYFGGSVYVSNTTTGGSSLQLGPTSPSANASAQLRMIYSNTVKNWLIGTNGTTAGALEFTPSSAAGGTSFTTPLLTLTDTSASISSTTDSSSTTTGALVVSGGLGVAKKAYFGDIINLSAATINTTATNFLFTKSTNNALRLSLLADALGIEIGATDSTGAATYKPMEFIGSSYKFNANAVLTVANATDASATTNAALIVSGGVGIAKKLYVGSNTVIGGAAAGLATLLEVVKSNAGGTVDIGIYNTDSANAASHANLRIFTNGASAGDPVINFEVNAVTRWVMGIDNSDSDKFKLDANSYTLGGGTTALSIDTSGNITTVGNIVMASATTLKLGGYTVATLPAAGTAGRTAYVTDATGPTYLGALTGGGAVVCPVFDNGSAWVSA